MKFAFKRLFWGFLLVLLEIHILVIDIFPDPVGYYLILSGLTWLIKDYPVGKKASNIAGFLIIFSIPTVFINQSNMNETIGQVDIFSGLSLYMVALELIKLVLVFYVFKFMLEIAQASADNNLYHRTLNTFKVYMIIMLVGHLLQAFTMNESGMVAFMVFALIVMLAMEVVFLVLLSKFSKLDDDFTSQAYNEQV
ncbi:hypothetical protein GH741_14035 [Aquibacillus halophilus]|uniref:Uncharacterized protein n=1 Tax=Aquibacillus halophilus TaxID=930132 RepID=A0A6A8DDP4_9BACI|nr:hypothetical protein [Aquibacillus halophilus]MRH43793.1 hypothetical protein [Aquibacillus halophilus]